MLLYKTKFGLRVLHITNNDEKNKLSFFIIIKFHFEWKFWMTFACNSIEI
jgi:hypothetical protein